MGNNVTFDEMNELLDEIYRSGGETWVEIDGQTYYTDWGYGVVAIEFFIRMLKNRKSDNDAIQARQDVVADVDEIIEHVINANMLSMPYDVYSALFDAVDGLGVEIENLQAENAKLRKELSDVYALHWNGFDCTECPWFDECDTTGGCHWLSIFIDHMRELGVEVDG